MSVLVETTEGTITIDLYCDSCPTTCLNFLKLCKIKYYNNCLFFNVQQNFIAQTGDPTGSPWMGELPCRNWKRRNVCVRKDVDGGRGTCYVVMVRRSGFLRTKSIES